MRPTEHEQRLMDQESGDELDRHAARKRQAYMRRAVSELQDVHGLSERDAASIMLTVTSVVSLGPTAAD